VNAFSKIAKKESPKTKKATTVTATVSDEVKTLVDKFVSNKAEIALKVSENKEYESRIIDEAYEQQRLMAVDSGEFAKSIDIEGNTSKVKYVTVDKFSVPQDEETLSEVKKLIGAQTYNAFFAVRRTITLKENITSDEKMLDKIAAACEKAGLPVEAIFDVTDRTFAVEGLDKKQFELPPEKLPEFRTLVKQTKASLR
jgi:hypothetical protein